MNNLIQTLYKWQGLVGATIGGLLGVIGAVIVARSLVLRERRSAARMLIQDLIKVDAGLEVLTFGEQVTFATVGAEGLAKNLPFYWHRLSPLFESQMSVIFGSWDRDLVGYLMIFYANYKEAEGVVEALEQAQLDDRDKERLPEILQDLSDYARAALYVLPLQQMGLFSRIRERRTRRLRPDRRDKKMQLLIRKLHQPVKEGDGRKARP